MSEQDKSREELAAEIVALRRRVKDLEQGLAAPSGVDLKRATEGADFYLTILDEAPALIWRAGKDARCDWFNATWLAFTGRELSQELGDGWAEGVHPEDFDRCLKTYLDAFHARRFFEMEYRLRRHDGEYRWILDIGCPFKDIDGLFAGYIGYCFDVTQRKRDEKFRQEVERVIRHDIKSPLAGLHGLAQLALADGIDDELRPLIPGLLRAVRHVINLVDSGDKFALLEQGLFKPEPARFSMSLLLRDVIGSLNPLTACRNVHVTLDARPGPLETDTLFFGDETLVFDMASNLVKNAVEATPPGGTVRVEAWAGPGALQLSVHNPGEVPPDMRERFFEKYATSGKPGGTGLGTYSARLIARAHGGDIRCDSSQERGTRVTVTLPLPDARVREA
ncbi:Autoinducer 2 sensor kinase/phosphatase LuxQ [Fundidesulfovibrio magnetotacticus]|uniref:histidine kinase n=1 Tax=Fundidesulfovibrio magnetotacticus TaxID=2730080 RepID=A0A6V8LMJ8_9BACT|nr:PAS domain-containing sensor histidine kinase [Fundidesulfovibrio magnetotacticus]GFK92924.1 Autoinducer 2 sensor kinase/phosphatase LuxQ [Fundidesulfovibrio magnetotacticus]